MSDIIFRNYQKSNYKIFFDRTSGFFIRLGNSGKEPFYNLEGPELLDISITNYCERNCDFCYRASNKFGKHMDFNEYKRLLKQAEKIGVLQIALGGGNPNQHPDFIKFLEETRKHFILPSYTTNGQGMTEDVYLATKKFCGAIAVSWYEPYVDARDVIDKCNEYDIKVNIHFLLNKKTIKEAIRLLSNERDLLRKINAIIFLNYKPIYTSADLCLIEDDVLLEFFDIITKVEICKIGFDSCMISYLTILKRKLRSETVEFCEASRFSAFISEDSFMYPCSFMCNTKWKGIDLKKTTLDKAWSNGDLFLKMRKVLNTPGEQEFPIRSCDKCEQYNFCHGGCQIFNINKCRY